MYWIIRCRIAASGIFPVVAATFSCAWATWLVAGMTTVMAGWETMNLSRNWGQFFASISFAQGGSGLPSKRRIRSFRWNGRLGLSVRA